MALARQEWRTSSSLLTKMQFVYYSNLFVLLSVLGLLVSDSSPLAVHLGNDNAMRRVLRDGVGIKDIQKKYLSMCYVRRCLVLAC